MKYIYYIYISIRLIIKYTVIMNGSTDINMSIIYTVDAQWQIHEGDWAPAPAPAAYKEGVRERKDEEEKERGKEKGRGMKKRGKGRKE